MKKLVFSLIFVIYLISVGCQNGMAQQYFTEITPTTTNNIKTDKRLSIRTDIPSSNLGTSLKVGTTNGVYPIAEFSGITGFYNAKIEISNVKEFAPVPNQELSKTEIGTWGTTTNGIPTGMGYIGSNTGIVGIGLQGNPTGLIVKQTITGSASATDYPDVIVGIGVKPNFGSGTYRLFVKDGIRTERVKVDLAAANGWADFVFDESYKLRSLEEVEKFIKTNKHLPDVPSEKEIKKEGYELTEMHKIQMQKIEELTLYLIELKKENDALKKRVEQLEKK